MNVAPRARLHATWALLLTIDVALQVMMKLAGDELHPVPFGAGLIAAALSSWLVWVSLAAYFATFVLWLAILHGSPLSVAFPPTALVYILVPLCGWLFLKENFSSAQALGIGLILAGILLQRGSSQAEP